MHRAGQLLGLAIGGCFCNDLQYVAHEMGVYLTSIAVDVTVDLEGSPLSRRMRKCEWRWRRPTNPRMWTASSSARGRSRPSATHLNVACRLNFCRQLFRPGGQQRLYALPPSQARLVYPEYYEGEPSLKSCARASFSRMSSERPSGGKRNTSPPFYKQTAASRQHSHAQCPLWVKSRHLQCTSRCPLSANSGHRERHGSTKNPRAFQRFARGFSGHIPN